MPPYALRLLLFVLLLAATVVLGRVAPNHPRWRPFVLALNLGLSLRYLWWRASDTLNWDSRVGLAVSVIVLAAEVYGFLVVLHHYLFSTQPVQRTAEPPDRSFSPSVDIMVTTYNESVAILFRTVVGCQAIDYANKRVYVLDDGRRPEVEALCRRLGAGYITRQSNEGAKAGNLNNGLAATTGEFVVTFDADHVPVRSFLQETLGFFRSRTVAFVQTAQHFYNPDLFQGRLRMEKYISNEQDMFFHVVQPGRDRSNSSFYCGSGAVFRRAAVADIGGFPTTTITEDLHTSMLLHSRGWRSVYVDRNLSAGLSPESFDAYLTQRRRWARGTLQVMLVQGGLFLRGLTATQRINYGATLWYWMYGFPRLVYLVAPLAYLFFGLKTMVVRDVTDLLAFYIPHLLLSIIGFHVANRGMRQLFWSDVYESCISVHIALTTLLFPFTARTVAFAVTPKGRVGENGPSRARRKHSWPLWGLASLVLAGVVKATVWLVVLGAHDEGILMNAVWAGYNLTVLLFGLMLLREPAQRRAALRLSRSFLCYLSWDGKRVGCRTSDLSETGVSVRLAQTYALPQLLDVTLVSPGGRQLTLRGRLVRCDGEEGGPLSAALTFVNRTADQHRSLVELMFSAPESWTASRRITIGALEHLARVVHSLAALVTSPKGRRRMSPRFVCNVPAVLVTPDGTTTEAQALDVSVVGAAVEVSAEWAVEEGTVFDLTLHWNIYERSTFHVKVVNVREVGTGGLLLGVAFHEPDAQQKRDLLRHLSGQARLAVGRAA